MDKRWCPGVPAAAAAANLSHKVHILENWAFCEVCGNFAPPMASVLAETRRGRNMPRVTKIRRDALMTRRATGLLKKILLEKTLI